MYLSTRVGLNIVISSYFIFPHISLLLIIYAFGKKKVGLWVPRSNPVIVSSNSNNKQVFRLFSALAERLAEKL